MPGRANLEDRRDEIDRREHGPDTRYLQRHKVIIDSDSGREGLLAQGRKTEPAGTRELAEEQAEVDQQHARGGQPEADVVHRREGHVANAELKRDDEVHEADDERHGDEEDHDRAVGGEDLVVMLGRQIALRRADRERLLRAHHDRIGEAADQHHQGKHDVHDADALVVGGRDLFVPQVRPCPDPGDPDRDSADASSTTIDVISGMG